MRRTASTLAVFVTPALLLVAACGNDRGTESVANADAATTIAGVLQPTASGAAYTVESGDSLWGIAERYCVDVTAIPGLNGWGDGLDHIIHPGDVVTLPAVGCQPSSSGSTPSGNTGNSSNTGTTNSPGNPDTTVAAAPRPASAAEVDAWLRAHSDFAPDPMLGNPSDYHEGFGPKCTAAWEKAYQFEQTGLGGADLLAAIDAIPGDTPSSIRSSVTAWAAFTDTWYPQYRAIITRHTGGDGVDYDALVVDGDYRTFLAHYLPVADDQLAPKTWVVNTCVAILQNG